MTWRIEHGDVRKTLKTFPDDHFDAVLSDPPYAYKFMGARWDYEMPSANVWSELLRVCKPGTHILLFGGPRTFHRLVVNVEDAGFLPTDLLMYLHGCLSEDTEILVDGGWVPYLEATEGRLAMCYDVERDSFEWLPIRQLFVYPYADTAYRIRSDFTDQIVTRTHRCLVEQGGAYVFEQAYEVGAGACVPVLEGVQELLEALPVSHDRSGEPQGELREGVSWRCAESQSNGHRQAEGAACGVSQCAVHSVQEEGVAFSFADACNSQGGDVLEALSRSASSTRIDEALSQGACCVVAGSESAVQCAHVGREQSCMEGRSDDLPQARKLCGCAVCAMPEGVSVDGSEGWLCDGASTVRGYGDRALLDACGDRSSWQSRSGGQSLGEFDAFCHEPRSQVIRASRFTRADLARFEPFYLEGVVWCVNVPTGAFVARRNGKAFVTGNSGFPKSSDIAKALDKQKGHWRGRAGKQKSENVGMGGPNFERSVKGEAITAEAQQYSGYGTALKPAYEPVLLAMKPLDGTFADNVQRWGTGALAIDACRVGDEERWNASPTHSGMWSSIANGESEGRSAVGRWPANVMFDEEAAAMLDAEHSGSSRFFYTTKVSRAERESGCHELPGKAQGVGALRDGKRAGVVNQLCPPGSKGASLPRAGAGRTGLVSNVHPTLKPIELTRWLATMLLPPSRKDGQPRRILVPFSGAGSEMIGCLQAGWDEVMGIEGEAEYIEIAKKRIQKGGVFSGLLDKRMLRRERESKDRAGSVTASSQVTRA